MPDYSAMYQKLFAAQADAIDGLKEITDNLIKAHRQVEEMYMDAPQLDIMALKPEDSTHQLRQKDESRRRRNADT